MVRAIKKSGGSTKKIIVVDFNGALLQKRPFEEAHRKWFELMAVLLRDESVKGYYQLADYFPKANELMRLYLGEVDERILTLFVRQTYSMILIAEMRREDLVVEFADYLGKLKKEYSLALVTSAPELAVEPILKKIGCSELFDMVLKSPSEKQPDKKALLDCFVKEHGKPEYYIGAGDKDIISCRKLGIKTVSVGWVMPAKIIGDFDVKKLGELGKIFV
ncbi:MAG: HAD hydrolase-like protein [archaeon]